MNDSQMLGYFVSLIIALFLTIVIELCLARKFKLVKPHDYLVIVGVNLLTNPFANLIFSNVTYSARYIEYSRKIPEMAERISVIYFLLIEWVVIIVEAILFKIIIKKKVKSFFMSLVLNVGSAVIGGLVLYVFI